MLALEKILANPSIEVEYIVLRYKAPDAELRRQADIYGIPCFTVKNVNDEEFLEKIRAYSVDINVSMSFDQILREGIIHLAPMGFINCHAGALPFYRGRNILNWAIINGEKEFGVTVHHVDEGIDTGDIILQRFAPIGRDDRYGDVLERAHHLCAEALHDALAMIESGEASRIPQASIHPVGFYCSGRDWGDEWIDWGWGSERIHNFVRGIAAPAPGARTLLGETECIIDITETIENAPEYLDKPGAIVGKDSEGLTVKTGDSTIRVRRVLDAGTGEESPIAKLRIGMRFSSRADGLGELDMEDKAVIVVGAGGHAKVLLDTLLERGVKVIGFLEKDIRAGGGGQHPRNTGPGDG